MGKFIVGALVGAAIVLVVQSPQAKPIFENTKGYVVNHVTQLVDDFVDSYVETRDNIGKPVEDPDKEGRV